LQYAANVQCGTMMVTL